MQSTLAILNPQIISELVALEAGWKAFAAEPARKKRRPRAPVKKPAKA
ncbi:MAG: hypothetical protein ACHQ17_08690 [Polyangia bacterium]|jgi:hypothetical protein